MKMNLKYALSLAAFGFSAFMFSQEERLINGKGCATEVPSEEWNAAFNKQVEEFKQKRASGKTQEETYVIPVVVHVIHGGQTVGTSATNPNITQAQVISQITALNADFAGTGYNVQNVPLDFAHLVANTGIVFCLAQYDPDGNLLAEPGIDRVDYTANGWNNPSSYSNINTFQNYINGTVKPATIWDPTRYFNIWVSDRHNNTGLLGYATFPAGTGLSGLSNGGTATTDGIWVWRRAFGTTGSAQSPYNRGRTSSHEIGHWLGLRHIWGDGQCATDYCDDTPSAQTQNQSCRTHPYNVDVCGGNSIGEMFMNFMDYTPDNCMYMFTPDQVIRMHTAMENGTYRNQLTASSATMCDMSALQPNAQFSFSKNTVCVGDVVGLNNTTNNDGSVTYFWTSSNDDNVYYEPESTADAPNLVFFAEGTYTVTLAATNGFGTMLVSHEIAVESCTGISERSLLSKKISLVPNPSSGVVNISAKLPENTNLHVSLYNMLGQELFTKTYSNSNNISLDLKDYPNGVYNVLISTGKEQVNKRLILNK